MINPIWDAINKHPLNVHFDSPAGISLRAAVERKMQSLSKEHKVIWFAIFEQAALQYGANFKALRYTRLAWERYYPKATS